MQSKKRVSFRSVVDREEEEENEKLIHITEKINELLFATNGEFRISESCFLFCSHEKSIEYLPENDIYLCSRCDRVVDFPESNDLVNDEPEFEQRVIARGDSNYGTSSGGVEYVHESVRKFVGSDSDTDVAEYIRMAVEMIGQSTESRSVASAPSTPENSETAGDSVFSKNRYNAIQLIKTFELITDGLITSCARNNENIAVLIRRYKPFATEVAKKTRKNTVPYFHVFFAHMKHLRAFAKDTNVDLGQFVRKTEFDKLLRVILTGDGSGGESKAPVHELNVSGFATEISYSDSLVLKQHAIKCVKLFGFVKTLDFQNQSKIRMTSYNKRDMSLKSNKRVKTSISKRQKSEKSETNDAKDTTMSYAFEHHVVAFLYLLKEGVRGVIKPCPVLGRLLPPYEIVNRFIAKMDETRLKVTRTATGYRAFLRMLMTTKKTKEIKQLFGSANVV